MTAELEKDIANSLNGIIEDYNKNGILDVELATSLIEKLVNLFVDDEVIDDIGKTFADIYNGNAHAQPSDEPADVSFFCDTDTLAGTVRAGLFSRIKNVLSKAIKGLWNNNRTTTTQSVSSIFRFEVQENGTKTLIWDFNWTKTTTPTLTAVTTTN